MNIEVANRLIKLRKEKGYTQESLADALGISRQAVSKWERAEASPDTDNLICLARLYGVSLDELLQDDRSSEEIKEDNVNHDNNKKKNNTKVEYDSNGGINVISDDGDEVYIGPRGIRVKEASGDNVNIGISGIHINVDEDNKNTVKVSEIVYSVSALLITIAYIILGFSKNLWHPAWILFLLIPVIGSLVDVIVKKRITRFNYPVLVVAVYLFLGLFYNLWHPMWVLFITIPVFYMVFNPIDRLIRGSFCNISIENDDEDEEDD